MNVKTKMYIKLVDILKDVKAILDEAGVTKFIELSKRSKHKLYNAVFYNLPGASKTRDGHIYTDFPTFRYLNKLELEDGRMFNPVFVSSAKYLADFEENIVQFWIDNRQNVDTLQDVEFWIAELSRRSEQ